MPAIKNVIFHYTRIAKPAPQYGEKKDCEFEDREYVTDLCLPAEEFQKLRKAYKKSVTVKKARTYDEEEYVEAFKCPVPEGDEYLNDSDEYVVIKLSAFTTFKDGEAAPVVEVVGTKSRGVTGNGLKIGSNVEIANGSTGTVFFTARTWDNQHGKGQALDLKAVQVKNLIPYIAKEPDEMSFDFEEEDEDEMTFDGEDNEGTDNEEEEKPQKTTKKKSASKDKDKPTKKKASKKKPAKEEVDEDDEDEDEDPWGDED